MQCSGRYALGVPPVLDGGWQELWAQLQDWQEESRTLVSLPQSSKGLGCYQFSLLLPSLPIDNITSPTTDFSHSSLLVNMKSFAVVAAVAALASAQTLTDLPACGVSHSIPQ